MNGKRNMRSQIVISCPGEDSDKIVSTLSGQLRSSKG
jgi:hypothetical protein